MTTCKDCKSENILEDPEDGEKVCEDCGLIQNGLCDDNNFCKDCKSEIILYFCKNCKSVNTSNFCDNCKENIFDAICFDCYSSNIELPKQPLLPNLGKEIQSKIRPSIKYEETKMLELEIYINIYKGKFGIISDELIDKVKQKLPLSPSKKDVLKVLKSNKELKINNIAVHKIYYEITGNSPVDFEKDVIGITDDVYKMIRFYWEWKPAGRNNFNYRYALYYLLKRRSYPVTLEDFPEIKNGDKFKKFCDDFLKHKKYLVHFLV